MYSKDGIVLRDKKTINDLLTKAFETFIGGDVKM